MQFYIVVDEYKKCVFIHYCFVVIHVIDCDYVLFKALKIYDSIGQMFKCDMYTVFILYFHVYSHITNSVPVHTVHRCFLKLQYLP